MRILVTGSSGFLGGALMARLAVEGHDLVLPVRVGPTAVPPIEEMTADRWRPLLAGADAVVHAAAIAHIGADVPRERYLAVNRDASARLAEAAAGEGVRRFVFLSSIRAQVGPTSAAVQDERTPPAPTEAYGESKLAAERLIAAAFPAAIHLRPALIAGGAPKGNLALLARLARTGLPLPFAGFDAPQAVVGRDNLVDAVLLALADDAMAGQTFVVADEPHPSLAGMLRWLREGMNMPHRLFGLPEPLLRWPAAMLGRAEAFARLTGGLRVDSARLRAAGWTPRQPLAEIFRAIGREVAGSGR